MDKLLTARRSSTITSSLFGGKKKGSAVDEAYLPDLNALTLPSLHDIYEPSSVGKAIRVSFPLCDCFS